MSNIPTMLTIDQTAERSGLAKHYIRQLCWKNKICYIKAGNKYLINFDKFVEFLNTGDSGSDTSSFLTGGIKVLR